MQTSHHCVLFSKAKDAQNKITALTRLHTIIAHHCKGCPEQDQRVNKVTTTIKQVCKGCPEQDQPLKPSCEKLSNKNAKDAQNKISV